MTSFDDKFMDYAIDIFFKKIDRIKERGWKGTFNFSYRMDFPKDWNITDRKNVLRIDVVFDPTRTKPSYQSGGGVLAKNVRVIIASRFGQNIPNLFSSYVHELQHIPQSYGSSNIMVHDLNKESDSYFEYIRKLKKRSKDLGRSIKPMSTTKYYHNIGHNQRNTEKESVLAQILYCLKYNFVDQSVDEAFHHGEYFTLSWKQFLNKSYYTKTPLDKITTWRELVVKKFEDYLFNNDSKYLTNSIMYNTKCWGYFLDKLPVLTMIERDKYKATVLEVFTNSDLNTENYKGYFRNIKNLQL